MIRILENGVVVETVATIEDALSRVSSNPVVTIDAGDLFAAQKAEAEALVVAQADNYGSRLTANYPSHERESWTAKIAEARAIEAGEVNPAKFPIIATECLFTGNSHVDTAANVLAKALPFSKASGAISGIRQEAVRRIRLADDMAGIDAALAWSKAAADAAFSSI